MTIIEVNGSSSIVKKRSVIVGIRIDGVSRELLIWALVKVADPGDHVLAIHVSKHSDSCAKEKLLLKEYLADYQGICTVRKINLCGEVLIGSSVRKVLVREAMNRAALAVVVGLNKGSSMGTSASVAKYCAKNIPSTTEIQAIHNGKVVFRRSLYHQLSGHIDPKPSYSLSRCSSLHGNVSKNGKVGRFEKHRRVSTFSFISEEIINETPGWPLLWAATSMGPPPNEARDMPLLKWVMNFPTRSLPDADVFHSNFCSSSSRVSFSRENISTSINNTDIMLWKYELRVENLDKILRKKSSNCKWFAFDVIRTSTSQFSPDNLIGKGGSNHVYKGILPNGKAVAVKVLKSSRGSWKDFTHEVEIMTSLRHNNITPLLGICVEDNDLISVYDFCSNGNLGENLQGTNNESSVLSWELRFRIAVETAEALNYLHEDCPRPVIHRDVKSSNILLSDELGSKLSDFGLAMWGQSDSTSLTINDVLGSFGYIAPEYFMYGKVSEKIDVYSFGVVLLELLSGREPICSEPVKGHESLVMWAKPKLESGDLRSITDPKLHGDIEAHQFERVALAARLCLTRSARFRPKISEILQVLKGKVDVDKWLNLWLEDQKGDGNADDEVYTNSSVESCLGLAKLDVDDTSTSFSSLEQNNETSSDGWSSMSSSLS